MERRKIRLYLSMALAAVLLGVLIYLGVGVNALRSVHYDYAGDAADVSAYTDILRVVSDRDYPPYSYLDENGNPCGRDIELVYAVARELEMNVELDMLPWNEAVNAMLDGDYDLLLSANYSSTRDKSLVYSVPLGEDSTVFFVREGYALPAGSEQLAELRLAALLGDTVKDNYLIPMGLANNTSFYSTLSTAFRDLAAGRRDAVICSYTVGMNCVRSGGYDIVPTGNSLFSNQFYFLYSDTNKALGRQVDAVLSSLKQDGTLDRLERKWIDRYEPDISLKEYLNTNLHQVLIVVLALVLVLFTTLSLIFRHFNVKEQRAQTIDPLTGIYTRREFFRQAQTIIRKHPDTDFLVVRVDMDRFKVYNETFGSATGDELLRSLGRIIRQRGRDHDGLPLYGYYGADHFLSLWRKADFDPQRHSKTIVDILSSLSPGYHFSVCIGIAEVDDPAQSVIGYSDKALMALKSVKGNYEKNWAYYSHDLGAALQNLDDVTAQMRRALRDGEFVPYFQPQYNYATGALCGTEALVRWKHPERGIVPPGFFLPLFEKNGFIYELDKYLWEAVCAHVRRWKDEGLNVPPISVNISRRDILHRDLADTICALVKKYNLSSKDIALEITESAYTDDPEMLRETMQQLSRAGFVVEMDDFGSGYSSLTALKDLPFDVVKLDMQFLQQSYSGDKSGSILSSVVRLAHQIDLTVIAEGVEHKEQADFLKSIGCYNMQGYLFAKPLSPEEYKIRLQSASITSLLRSDAELSHIDFLDASTQESLLFNSFLGGAFILEYRGEYMTVLRINDRFFEEMDIRREDWDATEGRLDRFLTADSRQVYRSMLDRAIAEGGEAECDSCAILPGDGRAIWNHSRVRCIARKIDSYIFYCSSENITLRKNAEERLRASEEKYMRLAAQCGDRDFENGILIRALRSVYPETILCDLSDNHYRRIQSDRQTAREGDWDELIAAWAAKIPAPEERKQFSEKLRSDSLRQLWRSGQKTLTVRCRRTDSRGRTRPAELTLLLLPDTGRREYLHIALGRYLDSEAGE